MRHDNWIKTAQKQAKKSNFPGSHMAALVVCNGRVIRCGLNRPRSGRAKSNCYKHHHALHCELDGILGLDPKLLRKAEIYVAGEKAKTGQTLLSKPCVYCQKFLAQFKIKAIYFHDQFGNVRRYA